MNEKKNDNNSYNIIIPLKYNVSVNKVVITAINLYLFSLFTSALNTLKWHVSTLIAATRCAIITPV